jgi:ABC-type antimicrobial peptide transport system permease subunit
MWGRKLWIGISTPLEARQRHFSTIRTLVTEEAKGAVLDDVGTLRAAVISSTGMAQVRSDAVIGGILCSIATLVALGGLATAVSEDVRRSAKSIAIRMALGASPARVIRETLHRGLRVVGLGIGVGALLCLLANRVVQALFWQGDGFVRGQLFSVGLARELFAPGVIGPLALLLFCAGAVAALVPASGAASKDPQRLLQEE